MITDHYKILGIDRTADTTLIKKAYRKLVLKFHPDVCKLSEAQAKFIEIQEAYEILGDYKKRYFYNMLFDSHFQPKEQSYSEKMYEEKVKKDYQKWKSSANTKATNLSKETYDKVKEKVFEGVGQVVNETTNVLAVIYGAFFLIGPFVGVSTSYASINGNWDIDINGNAIAGFVICSLICLLIVFCTIVYIKNKMKEE